MADDRMKKDDQNLGQQLPGRGGQVGQQGDKQAGQHGQQGQQGGQRKGMEDDDLDPGTTGRGGQNR